MSFSLSLVNSNTGGDFGFTYGTLILALGSCDQLRACLTHCVGRGEWVLLLCKGCVGL